MEEIVEMNQILTPYQEKKAEVDPDNIKDKCNLIEVKKIKLIFVFFIYFLQKKISKT